MEPCRIRLPLECSEGSLQGMDVHYIVSNEDTLKQAMDRYTAWLDEQIEVQLQNVDHSVDQADILEK